MIAYHVIEDVPGPIVAPLFSHLAGPIDTSAKQP